MTGLVKRKQHCLELCEVLSDFQQKGSLCDIAITTSSDEIVFAHKTVLAASSSYFLGINTEGSSENEGDIGYKLDLSQYTKDIVQQVIVYIYTGQLNLTEENAKDFLSLFDEWKVESGISLCQKYTEKLLPLTPAKESQINGRTFRSRRNTRYEVSNRSNTYKTEDDHNDKDVDENLLDEIKEEVPDDDYCEDDDGDEDYQAAINPTVKPKHKPLVRRRGRPPKNKTVTRRRVLGKKKRCPRCKGVFYGAKELRDHKKTCDVQKTVYTRDCEVCHNSFDTRVKGAKHCSVCKVLSEDGMEMADARGTKGSEDDSSEEKQRRRHRKCHRCHQAFDTPDELLLHKDDCRPMKIGRPGNSRRCRKCKISFETPEMCSAHQNRCKVYVPKPIPENFKFKCDRCSDSFVKRRTLRLHILRSHWEPGMEGPEYYFCKVEGCTFKTMYQYYMRKHNNMTHSPGKPAMCDICGSMSKNDHYLKAHKKMCHSEEVPCDMCSLVLKSEQGLRMHKRRVHGFGQPTKLCAQCTYTTYTKSELDRHMFQKHDVPMPSGRMERCPFCDHKTLTKAAMDDHVLRHTAEERKFPCPECKKSFVTEKDLRAHLQVHNPERKRYKCPYCDYSTPYGRFKLGIHIDTMHEKKDYKPWVCDICSYRTNIKGNLTLHLRNTHKLSVTTKTRTIHKLPPILPSQFRNNTSTTKPPAKTKEKERHRPVVQRTELDIAVQDLEGQCHNQQPATYEMIDSDRLSTTHSTEHQPTYTKLDSAGMDREGPSFTNLHPPHVSIVQHSNEESHMMGLPSISSANTMPQNMGSGAMMHHPMHHITPVVTLPYGSIPVTRLHNQTEETPPPAMYMDSLISSLVPRNDQQL